MLWKYSVFLPLVTVEQCGQWNLTGVVVLGAVERDQHMVAEATQAGRAAAGFKRAHGYNGTATINQACVNPVVFQVGC
jgi:hypothetical protein